MNCKTCEYALWNLRTHVCPECGVAFRIEDFEFMPTTVRFCCPHCNQPYYGTDSKGHLEPREFDCVTCGKPITMEEMVVLPAEGLSTRETAPSLLPWMNHESFGFFGRWMRMIGWGFASGFEIGRSLPEKPSWLQSLGYLLLTLLTSLLLSTVPFVCFMGFMMNAANRGGGGAGGGGAAPGFVMVWAFGGFAVFLFVLVAIGAVFMIGGSHLVLKVSGGAPAGLSRTTESVCYSAGPIVMGGLPCFGYYIFVIGWIWWAISAGMALSKAHGVGTVRGVIATLIPGIAYPALVVGGYIALVLVAIGRSGATTAQVFAGSTSTQSATTSLTMSWRMRMTQNNAPLAVHASSFLDVGFVQPDTFLAPDSILALTDVPVGSMTLADFDGGAMSFSPAQSAAIQEATDALPADTVAHRVGDYVFTYHGIDMTTMSQRLWAVIAWPVRSADAPLTADYTIAVGQVNSERRDITVGEFVEELADQNALRATFNLAPLPMPDTVTHERPATAGDQ